VSGLGERPVGELIEALAAPSPAPGGGSSAALTCAIAAGLAEMTAAIAGASADPAASERLDERGSRAAELRQSALTLADRELSSYRPVLAAIREAPGRADHDRRVSEARATASEPPLEIALAAAEVSAIALELAGHASASVRGDVVTSVLLAEAAARSAATLVETNLRRSPDDERVMAARRAAQEAESARRRVLG
jgi:formiminotetrahydrofolate cyclodeaminase